MLGPIYPSCTPQAAKQVDWEYWLTAPGLPKHRPQYDTSRVAEAKSLGDRLASGATPSVGPLTPTH